MGEVFNFDEYALKIAEGYRERTNISQPIAVNDANKERVKPDGTVKLMWHLLDWSVLEDDIRAMMFGAQKYSENAWRKGVSFTDLLDATFRHIAKFIEGEMNAQDSGVPHLSHARANLMFLAFMSKHLARYTEVTDMDRFNSAPVEVK